MTFGNLSFQLGDLNRDRSGRLQVKNPHAPTATRVMEW
jgi:hypothetical protein